MIFVLSTGRCGSTTLASLLNALPGIRCFHEKEPRLIEEARAYLRGRLSRGEVVHLLRETRRPPAPAPRFAESNQKLSYMIDALAEAFPQAAYIWLVRNGLDVVASFEHRGTYRLTEANAPPGRGLWIKHRIRGNEVGAMSDREWNRLDPFAKTCWYWDWTNRKIRADLRRLGAEWILVRLEDLPRRIDALAQFLGTDVPPGLTIPVMNRSTNALAGAAYWSRAQRRTFQRRCGGLMDDLYPGWREALRLGAFEQVRNEALAAVSYRSPLGRALAPFVDLVSPSIPAAVKARARGWGLIDPYRSGRG